VLTDYDLIVAGSGITAISHLTLETINAISIADEVLHVLTDPLMQHKVESLNKNCVDMKTYYVEGMERRTTYNRMRDRIVDTVTSGKVTCALFYGHPGVFVTPSFEAVTILRGKGFRCRVLPGISAEDCMFADLEFDPADQGCQSYEATAFILRRKLFDPTSALVLWQISSMGDVTHSTTRDDRTGLTILKNRLAESYGADHQVFIYEAAIFPTTKPRIKQLPLDELDREQPSGISTLYVPPLKEDDAYDTDVATSLGLLEAVRA
jgi:uncharacterized protein YabN with tetrapyrrole methylase and pyrophosphatase domain